MSFSGFAKGFADTLPTGIQFARDRRERGKERAANDVMAILGQIETFQPGAGTFDPNSQALPDAGQTAKKPNQGYDGTDFFKLQQQLFSAMGKLGDLDQYAKAKEAFGTIRMEKINESIDSAIAAYDRGDMAGAAQLAAGASAYMQPGVTPEVAIDPKSGAFIVANYEGGEPTGGYALTRDQLLDFRARNTDWNAWADRELREEYYDKEHQLNLERFAQTKKMDDAKLRLDQSADERASTLNAVQVANENIRQRVLTSQADVAEATQAGAIEAANAKSFYDIAKANADLEVLPSATEASIATNKATTATQTEEARKAENARTEAAMKFVDTMTTFNATEAEELRSSRGNVNMGAAMGALIGNESGGDPNARSGKGASGLGQIMPDNIVPWSREMLPSLVAGMSDEQIRSLYASNADFQRQLAEAKFTQLVDKHGLRDAYSIWHSGRPLAQATREGAHDGNMSTAAYVDKMMASYAAGGGVSEGGPGGATAIPEEDPLAAFAASVEEGKEKKPEDVYRRDPYFYEAPNERGEVYLKGDLATLMYKTADAIAKANPDASPEEIGLMVYDTFGPIGKGQIVADPNDPETATLRNGINSFEIPGAIAYQVDQFQTDMRVQKRENTPPTADEVQAYAPAPAQPAPQAPIQQNAIPEPESLPPGQVPSVPLPVSPTFAEGVGLPQQPSVAPGADPHAAPNLEPPGAAPRGIDDTAASSWTPNGQTPTYDPNLVLSSLPQGRAIMQAVAALQRAGGAPNSPAALQLQSIIAQVPEAVRARVVQEIQALLSGGGR